MAIRLSVVIPVASASHVQAASTTTYASAAASVDAASIEASNSYVQAASTASYVLSAASVDVVVLIAAAVLDKAGFYKYFRDVLVVSEGKSFSLSRPLSDTTLVFDTPALSLALPRADSVSNSDTTTTEARKGLFDATAVASAQAYALTRGAETDSILALDSDTRVFTKASSEEVSVSEIASRDVGKAAADLFVADEAHQITFAKPTEDAFAVFDTPSLGLEKPFADSTVTSDTDVYVFGKGLFETPTITEAARYELDRPLADSYTVLDAHANSFSTSRSEDIFIGDILTPTLIYVRHFDDGFALNDNFGAGDGIAFVWERTIANVAIMGDNSTIALQYGKSDGAVIVESGSLVSQGYCDPTYFAEDYVGDSRSF